MWEKGLLVLAMFKPDLNGIAIYLSKEEKKEEKTSAMLVVCLALCRSSHCVEVKVKIVFL